MNKALVLGGAATAVGVDTALGMALRDQPTSVKGVVVAGEFVGATGLTFWGKGNVSAFGLGLLSGLVAEVTLFALATAIPEPEPIALSPRTAPLLAQGLRAVPYSQQRLVAFGSGSI